MTTHGHLRILARMASKGMIRRLLVALVTAVVAALALVGCTGDATTTAGTTTTIANKGIQVETPDGQVSLSLNGNLPPGWPSAFPIPSGATPAGSGSLGDTTKTVMIGVYKAPGSPEDAFNFYKTNSALTVQNPTSHDIGPAFAGKLAFTGTYTGSLAVVSFEGKGLIVIVLETAGAPGKTGTSQTSGTSGSATTTAKA
jgi:hypothetical protein